MRLVADDHRVQILPVPVHFPRIDDFLLDKPEHEQHLCVCHDIVFVRKQALKVKIDDARIYL